MTEIRAAAVLSLLEGSLAKALLRLLPSLVLGNIVTLVYFAVRPPSILGGLP